MTKADWKAHRRLQRVRVRRLLKAAAFDPAMLQTITYDALGIPRVETF